MLKLRAREATAWIFVAGFGCGILTGAIAALSVVWASRDPVVARAIVAREHPRTAPSNDEPMAGVRPEPVPTTGKTAATGDTATPGAPPAARGPVSDPPPELAGRDLVIPVQGVGAQDLVRSFSDARGIRQHEAIDILAPKHTPVLAAESGRIAKLFTSKAGGITVYQFDPGEQFCYYYAHLDRYAEGLAEGQLVEKGQVIGYVGISGNAPKDTPHLHFAVFRLGPDKRWWEGTPIDPYDVLR